MVATWYGDGRQSSPIPAQAISNRRQRLAKTVKIQVKWAAAHPGQDRRLPGVVTHSRLQRATSVRSRVGIVLEDDSRVAIDWVTGRSYSSARRRRQGKQDTRRCRSRKSHSKIKADDEFGITIQREGFERVCLDCI